MASTSSPFLKLRIALRQSGSTTDPTGEQAIDAARRTTEDTEIGNRLDRALHLVALLVVLRELFPRIGQTLLHAQADTTTVFVDLEDHHFNFIAQSNNLGWMERSCWSSPFPKRVPDLRYLFDFNERTVVGQVGHLTEQTGALRVATAQTDPRIVAQLFQPQRYAVS